MFDLVLAAVSGVASKERHAPTHLETAARMAHWHSAKSDLGLASGHSRYGESYPGNGKHSSEHVGWVED